MSEPVQPGERILAVAVWAAITCLGCLVFPVLGEMQTPPVGDDIPFLEIAFNAGRAKPVQGSEGAEELLPSAGSTFGRDTERLLKVDADRQGLREALSRLIAEVEARKSWETSTVVLDSLAHAADAIRVSLALDSDLYASGSGGAV